MNKYLILLVSFILGCGIAPTDAGKTLELISGQTSEWCGWGPPDPDTMEVEKAFNHPDGFGLTGTYGCFEFDAQWPGGFCWAPGTLVVKGRLFTDGQNTAWVNNMTDEWNSWKNRLNARGWQVSETTGSPAPTMNVHTDTTTSGPGVLAESLQNTWTLHSGFDQGDYWTYAKCDVKVYKLRIEALPAYIASSSSQRTKYLHNIWDHEYEHCAGLAHTDTENLLMSDVYYFPGPRFDNYLNPTANELQMIDDFEPLN